MAICPQPDDAADGLSIALCHIHVMRYTMIAYLDGKPVMAGERWVVLEVNGIGYRVNVPNRRSARSPMTGR